VGGTIICLLAILFSAFIIFFASKVVLRKFKKNIDYDNWHDIAAIGLSLSLCAILLRNTFMALGLSPLIIIALLIPIIIVARSKLKNTVLRKLSYIFLVLTVISFSNFIIDASQAKNPISDWTTQNKKFNDQIKFSKKPNVYLIITESYPNKEALGKIYNFDNNLFYEKLENRNFTLHHKYYSNYKYTFSSLPSLFAMEHHYYSINLGNFDSAGGRSMLEAKTYNPVVDIFRQNDYEIQYMVSGGGLIPKGASVDYFWPVPPAHLALETFLSHQDITKKSIFASHNQNLLKTLTDLFSKKAATDNPTFSFIYTGQPGHSTSRQTTKNKIETLNIFENFRQEHYKTIQKANTYLLGIIDLIFKNNNDPLIIIAGDHGSWGYRWGLDVQGNLVPNDLTFLDKFGVLMAIHFPVDYQKQFDSEFRTHVNLFRYVFAYLSNSNKILETKAKDDSYLQENGVAIIGGRILHNVLPFFQPQPQMDTKEP
jgi:hypothetical protein